ncbi:MULTISPECIES: hypothetical protein [unclassified Burkholderia]|uniref:hypothetical protein n=1 Tax=unclassified Burkholderia TaxID=2613784 RepID=UPI0005CE6EAC|nr:MULTISPECIES: hypothetical protein [unclassified Burkholderia]MCR4466875.1 hypothetical protein [Burkholderia sp. SCN-KJ]RQR86758.1 hypothetical protein DIE10_08415 [Burkholderia sp. Bp9011]RQR96254.1 hypothetical protein DIE09_08595 [Burkholderia sp. Bp9010]RQS14073.1 hypothetical protein DIE02_01965 [Burkholderia sp. Bp8991]RQS46138.1 hypothetical protein DIE01_00120 [Burkholderia sp. Bp8990]
MLSPHELAALMLIKSSPDQIDMEREELDTLLEQQLVILERLASGVRRPSVTDDGELLLRAVMRAH